jgi:hypothetical protein
MKPIQVASLFLMVSLAQGFAAAQRQPPSDRTIAEADRAARAAALELAEENQTHNFRKKCILEIAETASGLPAEYDLLMYYGHFQLGFIRIQCRENDATGVLLTSTTIRRGTLPRLRLDHFVRSFLFLRRAQQRYRAGFQPPSSWMAGVGCPATYLTIEIRSSVEDALILKTPTAEWLPQPVLAIREREGVQPFALAWFGDTVLTMCRGHLQDDTDQAKTTGQLVHRLEGMRRGKRELIDYLRTDRQAIEAEICAELLLARKEPDALSQFRRLGLTEYARKLEIALATEPADLLRRILADPEDDLWYWAFHQLPARLDLDQQHSVLVDSLTLDQRPVHARQIIERLEEFPADESTLRTVREIYEEQPSISELGVVAATYLLTKTDEDQYFDYLRQVALTPRDDPKRYSDPPSEAIKALGRLPVTDQQRQQQMAEITRTLLRRLPRDLHPRWGNLLCLVDCLGRVGGQQDVELLREYCEDSSVRVKATFALARIDSRVALELARRHVTTLVTLLGEPPSRHNTAGQHMNEVLDYVGLFLAYGDREVISTYEQYLAYITAEAEPGSDNQYYREQTTGLLNILRSRNVDEELNRILRHIRVHGPCFSADGNDDDAFLRTVLAERLGKHAGEKEQIYEELLAAQRDWHDAMEAAMDP